MWKKLVARLGYLADPACLKFLKSMETKRFYVCVLMKFMDINIQYLLTILNF